MEEQAAILQTKKQPGHDVLVVKNLYKSFGSNAVLADFNLTLGKGENLLVLGKSGSGKSVLIKCIIGLLEQPESNPRPCSCI